MVYRIEFEDPEDQKLYEAAQRGESFHCNTCEKPFKLDVEGLESDNDDEDDFRPDYWDTEWCPECQEKQHRCCTDPLYRHQMMQDLKLGIQKIMDERRVVDPEMDQLLKDLR